MVVRKKKQSRSTRQKPLSAAAKITIVLLVTLVIAADVLLAYYYIILKPAQQAKPAATQKTFSVQAPPPTSDTNRRVTSASAPVSAVRLQSRPAERKVAGSFRFKVPSKNPLFGMGFDYSRSTSGTLTQVPLTAKARTGILVDLDNHKVLWEKDSCRGVPIASMTKMMTALLIFERLENDHRLTLETILPVSKAASMVGESSVYLRENETFALHEYMKAMVVKSANDATFLIGEYLAGGNIEEFVRMMNAKARALKMPGARYTTPNGLPNLKKEDCLGSAEGMALLSERLLEYPLYNEFASSKGGKIRQMVYSNTNTLLKVAGVDGMKTGYTRASGSCITVSCLRNNRRLIVVLTGFPSSSERNECAAQLLNWGYKN